ncbi:MAG: 4Fe-4S dicluster domain-containing protein [Acidimicrobiia bacterium]
MDESWRDGPGETGGSWVMRSAGLHRLVTALTERYDQVIGPVAVDGVIRLRPITSALDLPVGVTDEQEAASYRLAPSGTKLRFSYGLGPDSLKAIVHPPRSPVWTMRRRDGSLVIDPTPTEAVTHAVIGARACDLHALDVLERTQVGGPHADPAFRSRRGGLFVVAVDCTEPSAVCFCDTAGGGRAGDHGYDLALTEFVDGRHGVSYLVRAGTDRGRDLVTELELEPAPDQLLRRVGRELDDRIRHQLRELPADAQHLVADPEHPHWDDVAERCLTCGNCTAVCPTCFCTDMDDAVSLDGDTATRTRVWDSCFSMEYSHLGAGPHRASPRSRYRQWLSHKVGTWHDQFGESGCVGCGRCITWCPVGIDLTAELEALGRPVGSPT